LPSKEEVIIGDDGSEEFIAGLSPYNIFGEVAVLCNIPQPYTVRVCELCKLLRMEKQSLTGILQLYFKDSRQILSNLLKVHYQVTVPANCHSKDVRIIAYSTIHL
jgi:potassium channel